MWSIQFMNRLVPSALSSIHVLAQVRMLEWWDWVCLMGCNISWSSIVIELWKNFAVGVGVIELWWVVIYVRCCWYFCLKWIGYLWAMSCWCFVGCCELCWIVHKMHCVKTIVLKVNLKCMTICQLAKKTTHTPCTHKQTHIIITHITE